MIEKKQPLTPEEINQQRRGELRLSHAHNVLPIYVVRDTQMDPTTPTSGAARATHIRRPRNVRVQTLFGK